jgi:DNA/RNA endonuclease YhcR with UshA esterase domain
MSDDSDRITGPAQSSIASTKSFATEPAAKASRALAAIDLDKAFALVGKKGSFEGTVSQAYTTDNNGIVSLDFARDYKTALTAVVFPKDYKKFPNLQLLKGKSVVVSGQFKAYEGRAEIVMTDPKQVTILK